MDKRKLFSSMFLGGFIAGIVYANLFAVEYLSMTSVFNQYYLKDYQETIVSFSEYLPLLLKIRGVPLLFILLMTFSKVHKVISIIFSIWVGFLWGIYVSLAVINFGIKGVLFSLVGTMPQMLCYIPAFLIVLLCCYEHPHIRWNLWKSIVVFVCFTLGIILEGQINPYVVKWFTRMM